MVTYSILKHILLFHCLLLKPLTANLTYMQSISCTVLGWMKHKLESRLLGEVSITADLLVMPESEKDLKNFFFFFSKELLDECERGK